MPKIEVESEIAGTVWKFEKSVGETVDEEDSIMILESMKMEIPVLSPESGTIDTFHVAEGETVREGQILVTLSVE